MELLYAVLARWKCARTAGCREVRADTKVVIEAFPRSGNTFAYMAFKLSQVVPIEVAHHTHAPSQVVRAVRLNIPTLIIVRRPADAVASFCIREPEIGVRQALRAWLRFYAPLVPLRHKLAVESFEQVTINFGTVVKRLNSQFGTSFATFEHNHETVKDVFAAISARNASFSQSGEVSETAVARPSEARKNKTAEKKKEVLSQEGLLREAAHVYARLAGEDR